MSAPGVVDDDAATMLRRSLALSALALGLVAAPAGAATYSVPGTHAGRHPARRRRPTR